MTNFTIVLQLFACIEHVILANISYSNSNKVAGICYTISSIIFLIRANVFLKMN